MIGKTLAHYEISDKLGEGGMGAVYRARDTKLGRDVALKVLPSELASDAERRMRFEREARSVAALNHPNIVTIHSVEEVDGVPFLTMELVEGRTLADEIDSDGLPLGRFFDIAIPLADALSSAHAKGIAHRDLKPANIMADAEGRLKILDFGLAKLIRAEPDQAQTIGTDSHTAEGRILGTVAYMSPEQAEGAEVDHRSDVFSLGIVLYEMATGRRPFHGKTSISTISSILKDEPHLVTDLRETLPRHLGRIIKHCLAKQPDRRYQSALEVRNQLEELKAETTSQMAGQAASARDLATPGPMPRGSGRWIPWAAAIGGPVVVLVATATFLSQGTPEPHDPTASAAPTRERIVVFPFENLGPAEHAYFAAGITEEITSRLARIGKLSVMSRTSAVQYDRAGKTMQQIGSELGVAFVLEGTVRWEKRTDGTSRVRVTPQLIQATDDTHVWADSYDGEMEEIFAVQSEIAQQVVAKLNVALVPAEQQALEERQTDNIEAWHAFQRAVEYTSRSDIDSPETWEIGARMFERAVDLDASFTRAWAELARMHAAFVHWRFDISEERRARSKAAAERALALDREAPWSHMGLGYYHYWGQKDYEAALESFEQARLRLGEDSDVLGAIGSVLRRQGRFREALAYFEQSLSLAPRDTGILFAVAETAGSILGDYETADRHLDRLLSIVPEETWAYYFSATVRLEAGDADAARQAISACPFPARADSELSNLLHLRITLGDLDEALVSAEALSQELVDGQFKLTCRSLEQGLVLRCMGQPDRARVAFERARQALEARAAQTPNDARTHSALGKAYAGLGRAEDAVREGKLGIQLAPPSVDAYIAPTHVCDLATIHILLGQHERALDQLEKIYGVPPLTAAPRGWLLHSPLVKPLRDLPRFRKMVGQ